MDLNFILIVLTALITGFAKTGVPGCGILAVPLLAMVFDKSSVGVLLPMLIVADTIAIIRYRKHAHWAHIKGLFLWVAVGIGFGAFFLSKLDTDIFKPVLGAIVIILLLIDTLRIKLNWRHMPESLWFAALIGILTGIATTIGNAAGPIMTIYLLSRGQHKLQFVGSMAWFFLIVNCSKLPIYYYQGLITKTGLIIDLKMLPAIFIGALIGIWILPKINQRLFKNMVILLAIIASIKLLLN